MNPFLYGGIVKGEYFYNRVEEIKYIAETLSGGNNFILYAPRRYGKSSLVQKMLLLLEEQGYTTLYFDFMSIYSLEKFIEEYSKQILSKRKWTAEQSLKKFSQFVHGLSPSVSFDNFGNPVFSIAYHSDVNTDSTLADVINLPEKLASGDKRWIIAFDEFQEIEKLNGDSFEKMLRSQVQHHQNVSYLFLGSKTHILQDMFLNKSRAFYNIGKLMQLNLIDRKESVKYIISRFSRDRLTITEEIANYIIETAGNIPYYIQFLSAETWQTSINTENKVINKQHVDSAVDRLLTIRNDYYWEKLERQTANKKKILIALAHSGKEVFSKKNAVRFGLSTPSSIQKSIVNLLDEGIIERFNNEYYFSDPFFRDFILNNL